MVSHCGFELHSQIIGDAEHLFLCTFSMCLLAFCLNNHAHLPLNIFIIIFFQANAAYYFVFTKSWIFHMYLILLRSFLFISVHCPEPHPSAVARIVSMCGEEWFVLPTCTQNSLVGITRNTDSSAPNESRKSHLPKWRIKKASSLL